MINTYSLSQAKDSRVLLLTRIILGSCLIALCAQIRIPLPFTPVPITLQTLAVMLVGGALGSRNGALSVLLYLAESMLGLPVLSGFRIDPLALFSPVGGYLVGFVFQAYLTGWFVENQSIKKRISLLPGVALASVLGMGCGALWLAPFVGFNNIFMMGFLPFIPGEMLKIFIALTVFVRNGSRT